MSTPTIATSLAISVVPTVPIYTDYGGGAALNVAIYRPASIPDGWYYLGDLALPLPKSVPYTDPSVAAIAPYAVLVQPLDAKAICPVSASSLPLWTDQKSGGAQDIEIWAPLPTTASGYASVGLFAWVDEGYGGSPVGSTYWNKLAAINSALLEPGQAGTQIWTDHDSGADGNGQWTDIALWSITGGTGVIPTSTFIAAPSYATPPEGLVPSPSILLTV